MAMAAVTVGLPGTAAAQSINWNGQTGGVVTPFATVAESPARGLGRPMVSFLVLPAGDVIGTRFQIAVTEGIGGRVEVGYVKSAVGGSTEGLSRLFDRGFQAVHGTVRLIGSRDGAGSPAVAVGAQFAWQVNSLTEAAPLRTGDVHVVVTKSVAPTDRVAILLSGGVTMTNAALLSLGGNATSWSARGFAAGALVVRDAVTVGVEVLQQPQEIQDFGDATIPPTVTVFARVFAARRVSVVAAYLRLAGEVAPGTDLKALNRFILGATVRF